MVTMTGSGRARPEPRVLHLALMWLAGPKYLGHLLLSPVILKGLMEVLPYQMLVL